MAAPRTCHLRNMKTPESMQRLEELFHEAAGLEPPERAEFISRARESNPELVAELPVLAVLVEDGDVWHVVEKPLAGGTSAKYLELVARVRATVTGALAHQDSLGHTQTVSPGLIVNVTSSTPTTVPPSVSNSTRRCSIETSGCGSSASVPGWRGAGVIWSIAAEPRP